MSVGLFLCINQLNDCAVFGYGHVASRVGLREVSINRGLCVINYVAHRIQSCMGSMAHSVLILATENIMCLKAL
jgi:hypothetical protein